MLKKNVTLTKDELLQRKLRSAMKYAHDVCVLGSTNRMQDITRTNGWSYAQQYRYDYSGRYARTADEAENRPNMFLCNVEYDAEKNACHNKDAKWFYRVDNISTGRFCNTPIQLYKRGNNDPIRDHRFNMYGEKKAIIFSAIRAEATRSGNCGAQARLVSKYLWEHHSGIDRIEIISMESFDHSFVIVNRSGDLNQSDTWGDAWIIDPWAMGGLIYPASEFPQKINEIKNFVYTEAMQLFNLGIAVSSGVELADVNRHCVVDIRPEKDKYPTYHSRMMADDYYEYNDNRFTGDIDAVALYAKLIKESHALRFDDCLDEIKAIKTNPAWCKLFHKNKNTREVNENHREHKRSRQK